VDSWRQSLTPRQIEIFEAEAGEFLTTLGYVPLHGIRASRRAGNNLRRHWRAKRTLR
jgi:hypothetical protein